MSFIKFSSFLKVAIVSTMPLIVATTFIVVSAEPVFANNGNGNGNGKPKSNRGNSASNRNDGDRGNSSASRGNSASNRNDGNRGNSSASRGNSASNRNDGDRGNSSTTRGNSASNRNDGDRGNSSQSGGNSRSSSSGNSSSTNANSSGSQSTSSRNTSNSNVGRAVSRELPGVTAADASPTALSRAAPNSVSGKLATYRSSRLSFIDSVEKQNVAYAEYQRLSQMSAAQAAAVYPNGDHATALANATAAYVSLHDLATRKQEETRAALLQVSDGRALSDQAVRQLHDMLGF